MVIVEDIHSNIIFENFIHLQHNYYKFHSPATQSESISEYTGLLLLTPTLIIISNKGIAIYNKCVLVFHWKGIAILTESVGTFTFATTIIIE